MTFLMDKNARPSPRDMKLWVDVVRFIKRGAKGGAFGFFTYMELSALSHLRTYFIELTESSAIWLLVFHLLRLDRLKWCGFLVVSDSVTGIADCGS